MMLLTSNLSKFTAGSAETADFVARRVRACPQHQQPPSEVTVIDTPTAR